MQLITREFNYLSADPYNLFNRVLIYIFLGELIQEMGPELLCLLNPKTTNSIKFDSLGKNKTGCVKKRLTASAKSGIGSGNLYSAAALHICFFDVGDATDEER